MSTKSSDFSPSTDIYSIVEQIDSIKKRYIEDENETTLAIGMFGFLGDTEAKKIQTAIINTGELGNEMFPQRAKLDKNIVTHAIYCNVDNLNATPAHMTINIAIRVSDLDLYMKNGQFIFDHMCPIMIGDYEFHLDYDIILHRSERNGKYVYNAYYDMTTVNNLSDITNPYLLQPYLMNFNNYPYIFLQALVRQTTIETTIDKMITASVIDNKSFTFSFSNQLADFDVYITENGKTTRLKPLIYGSAVETGTTNYCWYLYMNDDNIRIGFDQSSYLPGLNAEVKIVAQTTQGMEGNFDYKSDLDDAGFYVDFESSIYNFKTITCYVNCATNSTDGTDKKSTEELKGLIPKMAMSRGYITTETDLNGYFNLISTDSNKLQLQKKVDNQLNRIWYCYLLMKDKIGNVIPTNTLPIKIDLDDLYVLPCEDEDGRYVIPCGTTFCYDPEVGYAVYIAESDIPEKYSAEYYGNKYYYRTIHNMVVNVNPLYCSYYNTIVYIDNYFEYEYVNEKIDLGFIANTFHFERSLLSKKDEYRLTLNLAQSVNENYGLYIEDRHGDEVIVTNNMKVFLVLYQEGIPYRYAEAELTAYDTSSFISSWEFIFKSDDQYDSKNRIRLNDLFEVGYDTKNYGYFENNTEAHIYIFGKFDQEYGRNGINKTIPGLEGYSLVNTYKLHDGITLFNNFTKVMNTRIRQNSSEDMTVINYSISGIPMVGEHFFMNEDNVIYFMNTLTEKKAYIDYCLTELENNMDIDFKFFNTYGHSYTYSLGNKEETTLGNIDTTWRFRLKLMNDNDSATKNNIVNYIKAYIEDLNEMRDLHVPNLLHDIKEEFSEVIIYIEFMNFNDNRLGINHIELRDVEDPHVVPEFISVRNNLADDGTTLEPAIEVEIVKS